MISDHDLLCQFAEQGDEAAFAEIVRRYADLVYSAALRLTSCNTSLAEDVSQQVFIDLARKAGTLSHHASLVGWLHTVTRYNARSVIRGEQRRQLREQEASLMHDNSPAPGTDWAQIQPLLDDAVGQLGAADSEAVLLRFFQGKSHREVGEVLGLGEDSARKRIDRALEKLRKHFARKGVKISSALLAGEMATNSVQAAPANFPAEWSAFALANQGDAGVGLVERTRWIPRIAGIVIFATLGIVVLCGLAIKWDLTKLPWLEPSTPTNQALGGIKPINGTAIELPKTAPAKAGGEAGEETISAKERDRLRRINTITKMYYPLTKFSIRRMIGTDTGADLNAKLTQFLLHEGFKFPPGVKVGYDESGLYFEGKPKDIFNVKGEIEKYCDPVAFLTRDGTVIFGPDAAHSKAVSFPPANVTYVDEQGKVVIVPPLPRLLGDGTDSTDPVEALRILSDLDESLAQGTVTVRIHTGQDVEEWSNELDIAHTKK